MQRRSDHLFAATVILLASACGGRPSLPGPFSRDDLAELTDPSVGGEARARLMFESLTLNPDRSILAPTWIDAEKTSLSRIALQDAETGALTEAQLWQASFAALGDFYKITRRTYPPQYKGSLAKPLSLAAAFRDEDESLQLAVGRLRSLHLEGSLGGRGGAAIDALEKISTEVDGIAGSLAVKDDSRFKTSVLAVSARTGDLFRAFQNPPP